jgi:molybdate transport repressor ModE-like protein
MDVQGLRLLREIARLGSISAAAEALGYTQSGASRQLGALERAAGHPLADRTATGARLTPAGEIVVRRSDAALTQLDDLRDELVRLATARPAGLRLLAFPTAMASFVPDAVRALAGSVEVDVSMSEEGLAGESILLDGQADVCLATRAPEAPPVPGVRAVELRRDPLWLCLPTDHPRAAQERVAVADLARERWISPATTLCADRGLLMETCERNGFLPEVVARSDDYAATQGLVAAGTGIALLPQMALRRLHPGVVVRAPRVPVLRRVVALTPSSRPAATDLLVDALRTAAADLPEPAGGPAGTTTGDPEAARRVLNRIPR